MKDQETIEAENAIQECIKNGSMEMVGLNESGEEMFKLTEKGRLEAENMLKENPLLFVEMGLEKSHLKIIK